MDNKTFKATLIMYAAILIALLSLLSISDFKKEPLQKKDVDELTNINTFYTIENCVVKYISYWSAKDYDSMYKLLDDNYIQKNKITKDNIKDYIESPDAFYTFSTTEIYRNKKQSIYYVKGILTQVTNDDEPKKKDFQTTVKLDSDNNKFSVIPDGDGGVVYE